MLILPRYLWLGTSFDVAHELPGPALRPAFDGIAPQSDISNVSETVSLSVFKTVIGIGTCVARKSFGTSHGPDVT